MMHDRAIRQGEPPFSLAQRIDVSPQELAPGDDATFHGIEFSDDGALLALGREGEVVVIDVERGTILRRVPLTNVFDGAFVPGAHRVELGSRVLSSFICTAAAITASGRRSGRLGPRGRSEASRLLENYITCELTATILEEYEPQTHRVLIRR